MTRVLIAGVGNVLFDVGIRARHLAYELLAPFELCVVADCMPRGGAPGTLYVLEPDAAAGAGSLADGHAMNLETVFAAVRQLGGAPPRTVIVGCEPEAIEPGIGLSATVARAVPAAIQLIRDLITSPREVAP